MTNLVNILLVLLFSLTGYLKVNAQYLKIKTSQKITDASGDDLNPSWSSDSKSVVFQSNRNGNEDIYLYSLLLDSTYQITNNSANETLPVFIGTTNSLAFTSDLSGFEQLYSKDIASEEVTLLINRTVQTKAASYPGSGYHFYCLGYNEIKKSWGLYRYEKKYGSLKHIMYLPDDEHLPKVSPDGELILYTSVIADSRKNQLNIINWYGNPETIIDCCSVKEPSWHADGLKIIFISDQDNKAGELYTIWKDGSHLERLTNDTLIVRNPAISPDGKTLAISVKGKEGYDIYLVPMTDY